MYAVFFVKKSVQGMSLRPRKCENFQIYCLRSGVSLAWLSRCSANRNL